MKKFLKNSIYAAAFVPLAIKIPYLLKAWESSPLERFDFVMYLCIPFCTAICAYVQFKADKFGKEILPKSTKFFLFLCLSAMLAGWAIFAFKINSAGIIFGIAIVASASAIRFGLNTLKAQIPTFIFAFFATPSLSYWLDCYLDTGINHAADFFWIKFASATLFAAFWNIFAIREKMYPKFSNIVYCAAIFTAILFNRIENATLESGNNFEIDTDKIASGDWISDESKQNASDAIFFADCYSVNRKNYFDKDSYASLLAVCTSSKASIHPVGICLKSSNVKVSDSIQTYVNAGEKKIQLNELVGEKRGNKFLIWTWFSDGKNSTGDFTKFRLSSPSVKWRHYQLTTPLSSSKENARKKLKNLLSEFSKQ